MSNPNVTTTANASNESNGSTVIETPKKKAGRAPLVINQQVIQNRFDKLAKASLSLEQNASVLAIVMAANLPAEHTADVRAQFAEAKSGARNEAWKQFQFLFVRLQNKISRKGDDAEFTSMHYDAMEALLPIILDLYGSGEDVENDEDDEE